MSVVLKSAAFACLMALLAAAKAAAAAPACTQPHYHDFDFWLGSWTVRDVKGTIVGRNDVTRSIADCVIQERWRGASGSIGSSFNIWNVESGKWHQTWVDNSGGLLLLDGGLVRGTMVLEGSMPDRKLGKVLNAIRWTPLPDGRVRQHWTSSSDGGKTWQDVFDGYYSKNSEPAAHANRSGRSGGSSRRERLP